MDTIHTQLVGTPHTPINQTTNRRSLDGCTRLVIGTNRLDRLAALCTDWTLREACLHATQTEAVLAKGAAMRVTTDFAAHATYCQCRLLHVRKTLERKTFSPRQLLGCEFLGHNEERWESVCTSFFFLFSFFESSGGHQPEFFFPPWQQRGKKL